MKIMNALLSTGALLILMVPQALAAPPGGHLNITEVFVDDPNNPTSIMIIGDDLLFGTQGLSVTLGDFGALAIIASPTDNLIEALLPASIPDGDYLLTVSGGNGQSENDEYDLTIGAVGPAGPAGQPGTPGISNYERVQAFGNTTGSQKSALVSCPGGKKVLGGGASS